MQRRWTIAFALVAACASSTPQPTTTPPSTPTPTPTPTPTSTPTPAPTATGAPLPDLLLPSEPLGGPGPTTPNAKPPPKEEQPGCATDQDCWSITCCPAVDADECVHHSLAQKCAIVDVTCPKLDAHLDCACEKGVCTGRAP